MNSQKIAQLEVEIKNLYQCNVNKNEGLFWSVHVKPVIDQAKELAEKYEADIDVVWLSAILHDIGQLEALEPHEVVGADLAYTLLKERDYDLLTAEKVKSTILTHRVNKFVPETLEQKILATADAMCHFKTPHYVWLARVNDSSLEELFLKISKKIDRDYADKIYFEDERKAIEPQYKMLKEWFALS